MKNKNSVVFTIINTTNNKYNMQIIELLNDTTLDINDFEKIRQICDKKIENLKTIDNIIFIRNLQDNFINDINYRILRIIQYKFKFIIEEYQNSKKQWDVFCNFDFYDAIEKEKISKEDFIKFCEKLKTLDLSGSCVSYFDEKSMSHTIKNIEENCDLIYNYINLSYNLICDEGLEILIPILQKQKNLEIINFSNNSISDIGLRQLKKLSCIETLKQIIIKENYGPSEETLEYIKKNWNIKIIF